MSNLMNRIEWFLSGRGAGDDRTYHQWDKLREAAMSPSEVAEIDAIFSRQIDDV